MIVADPADELCLRLVAWLLAKIIASCLMGPQGMECRCICHVQLIAPNTAVLLQPLSMTAEHIQ